MIPAALKLPAAEALTALDEALSTHGCAVFCAPPGSGKTTLAPPFLLEKLGEDGHIVMLEPRRAAARNAARRIAWALGEECGRRAGWRVRDDSCVSAATRIEVVTEGILVRKLQRDPELRGVKVLIFDEFHERNLFSDLSLALALDVRNNLRDDLKIVAMSATLNAGEVSALLGNAPVVRAEGRLFPVETRHLEKRPDPREAPEKAAMLALELMREKPGGAVVFLPGASEIARAIRAVEGKVPENTRVHPLYGMLPRSEQDAAILPAPDGVRKLVFATDLAESSITIEGVEIVVDSGLARVPVFDPSSGFTKLETRRISLASADQRRGRAGRTAPGVCLRMWRKADELAMAADTPPEIASADLATLALELKNWGTSAEELKFLTPPPAPNLAQAEQLLAALGLLDAAGRLTPSGRKAAQLPLHPRLSAMLIRAASIGCLPLAAEAAVVVEERPRLNSTDLEEHLHALRKSPEKLLELRRDHLLNLFNERYLEQDCDRLGLVCAFAYPDRVAVRKTSSPSEAYQTSAGKGVKLRPDDPLKRHRFLVAAHTDGDQANATLLLGAAVELEELERFFPEQFTNEVQVDFDRKKGVVASRRLFKFGAAVLSEAPLADPPAELVAEKLLAVVRAEGLRLLEWTPKAASLRARAAAIDPPNWSDEALLASLEEWLPPHLAGKRGLDDLRQLDLYQILKSRLGHGKFAELERAAPEFFTTPAGSRLRIDYSGAAPKLSAKLQEFYGCKLHPTVGGRPLLLELLSPAMRPIQVTSDLPKFWRGNWELVKKEMKSQYPKHLWADDPENTLPTSRTTKKSIYSGKK